MILCKNCKYYNPYDQVLYGNMGMCMLIDSEHVVNQDTLAAAYSLDGNDGKLVVSVEFGCVLGETEQPAV